MENSNYNFTFQCIVRKICFHISETFFGRTLEKNLKCLIFVSFDEVGKYISQKLWTDMRKGHTNFASRKK
jgi:hypothetical protein